GTGGGGGGERAGGGAAPAGWGEPVLVETFDGPRLDPARWGVYHTPDAEKSPRQADRVAIVNGALRLTGGLNDAGRDVSGGLASSLDLMYGRWEARFRVEPGIGYNAVLLLWPQSERWPDDGEIDMIEVSDAQRRGGAIFVHNGPQDHREMSGVSLDFTQWHTVAVEWLPNQITWSFDGVTRFVLRRPASGFNPIPSASPMHLAMQLDVGCWGTLPCRDSTTPQWVHMYVDDVRIWRAPQSMLR
ncbi:MAG: glycoside hydrolase family 16 protein, partial [Frankia sp.]|nr:glycoside hydrolase family 16 protein [Frankia sp.]